MTITTPPQTTGSVADTSWFVLTTSDPRRLQYRLEEQNMERADSPSFQLFVPYTFLSPNQRQDNFSKDYFSLRSALHRYLFVMGDEQLIATVLRQFNSTTDGIACFLSVITKDGSKCHARISQHDMDTLVAACGDEQVRLDRPLSLSDVKVGETFSLAGTPFEKDGSNYKVLAVRHKRGGAVELQVELTLFGIPFNNFFVTYNDVEEADPNGTIVYDAQKKLLDIFKRRVNNKENDVSRYEDRRTLQALFDKRNTVYPDGTMKRHFLALMLICCHLVGDQAEVRRFHDAVQAELTDIAKLRESKAATDTRAYLHIALYIATGEPRYRDLAKGYVQKHHPQSRYLCQFVATSAKRQARRHLGSIKN